MKGPLVCVIWSAFHITAGAWLWSPFASPNIASDFESELKSSCQPQLGKRGLFAFFEGVHRSSIFWASVIPLVADYTIAGKMNLGPKRDARFEELHHKHAPRLAKLALRLRGMFVKSAQQISSLGMIIPRPYLEALAPLQAEVPSKSLSEVISILQRELGNKPLDSVFAHIEPQPLGAATIGQAHRATLTHAYGGREVVVKVMYPEVDRQFRADVNALYAFARLPLFRGQILEQPMQY